MNIYEVLRRPVITEKNTMLGSLGKYTFEVDRRANKHLIKQAVEQIFKVDVVGVNIISVPGKMKRVGKSRGMTPSWKKAVVTVATGQRIEQLES